MTYKQLATTLYDMIYSGQLLEGFEKFYHDNVVMEEVGEEPRHGKDANRAYEEKFVASIKEIHGGGVDAITSDEENAITMVESSMDVTFKDDTRMHLRQVAVAKWDGEHIVSEKFYHK
jgi:hypothetical protein